MESITPVGKLIHVERERRHIHKMKSLFPASKIEVAWKMGDTIPYLFPARFLFGSYSVPSPHNRFYVK